MSWLAGLPTFAAGAALLYLVAHMQSRTLGIAVAVTGLVWLWFAMRRDHLKQASAGRSSGEAVPPDGERGT